MTKIVQKSQRPRIRPTLCLTYQDIIAVSGENVEVQTSIEPRPNFSPKNYFRILEYQLNDPYKCRDTAKKLRALGRDIKRINMLRLWRDIHKAKLSISQA